MSNLREAAQLALACIRWLAFGECRTPGFDGPPPTPAETVAAIEAVLAQPDDKEPRVTPEMLATIRQSLDALEDVGKSICEISDKYGLTDDKAQPVAGDEERPHWSGTMEGSGIAAWDELQVDELVRKVNMWKSAFWQERAKFQAETLRNSLISAAPRPPAEQGAELSDEFLFKEAWLALGYVPADRYRNDLLKLMRKVIAADRAARGGAA